MEMYDASNANILFEFNGKKFEFLVSDCDDIMEMLINCTKNEFFYMILEDEPEIFQMGINLDIKFSSPDSPNTSLLYFDQEIKTSSNNSLKINAKSIGTSIWTLCFYSCF